MSQKILVVYGTRPEAIKMAPVVAAMRASDELHAVVAVTGQHRAMLDQVNTLFNIRPDHDLNIIAERQTLASVTTRSLLGLGEVIDEVHPDAVLVQGDTTTCLAGALAAFYQKVPVIHLEAGLRTGQKYDPFPEEMNRRLTTQIASLHLAPTSTSRSNLLADGVSAAAIVVTGNTVIDALLSVTRRESPIQDATLRGLLSAIQDRQLLLITAHRRESWGEPMARAATAIALIARAFPDLVIVLPAHLNPAVRDVLLPPLAGLKNVTITEPLGYGDFSSVLARATVVLTDSGGVQEEAPSLGKPVLVMRDTTERPEAVAAGTVKLVGTSTQSIVAAVTRLLTDAAFYDSMARATNPYGDGHAADRAVAAIEHHFGLSDRPVDFVS